MRRPRLIHDHRRAPARWLVLYFEPGGWRCCRSFGSEPDAEHAARRFAFSVARRQQVSEWPRGRLPEGPRAIGAAAVFVDTQSGGFLVKQPRVVFDPEGEAWAVRFFERERECSRSFGSGPDAERRAYAFATALVARADAADTLAQELSAVRSDRSKLSVELALASYLVLERPRLSRSYYGLANGLVLNHLVPYFRGRSLDSIVRADALQFAAWMRDRGRSAAATGNALSLLRRVLQIAVDDGTLVRNTLRGVGYLVAGLSTQPLTETRRVPFYTREELKKLLAVSRTLYAARRPVGWLYPLLVFLAGTGARRGEALGLRREDVDLARGVVTIRRAMVRRHLKVPKTRRERTIPIDAAGSLLPAVLERVLAEPRRRDAADVVFVTGTGLAPDESNVGRAWRLLVTKAAREGVPRRRLHDLRHTFATHALDSGLPITTVGAWLGHADAGTTWRHYAHAIPRQQTTAGFLDCAPEEP